jgi:predicted RNA polymerase sigma factor
MEKIRLFAGILHASETSSKVSCRLCTAEVRGSNPLGSTLLLTGHHRLDAVRAHLLEMAGDNAAARSYYRTAARSTTSLPEQLYLEARAAG